MSSPIEVALGIETGPPENVFIPKRKRRKYLAKRSGIALLTICLIVASGIAWVLRETWAGREPTMPRTLAGKILPALLGPDLSVEQEIVKKRILDSANKPESVIFEKWYPTVKLPDGVAQAGEGDSAKLFECTHVVRIVFRMDVPLLGQLRFDRIYYFLGKVIIGTCDRLDPGDYDEVCSRYFDGDAARNPPESPSVSAPKPNAAQQIAGGILAAMNEDPTFADPTAQERLEMIYNLICAYNDDETGFLSPRAIVPPADTLKEWISRLPRRKLIEIDWRFNSRERYLEMFKGNRAGQGDGTISGLMNNSNVSMLEKPEDVFISPRDNLPFVIRKTVVNFPKDAYHSGPLVIVAAEQKGVVGENRRFLEQETQRLCIRLERHIDMIHTPVEE
ncbi:hypothetical protein [Singulisphaera acidiphila]|nr:hypothetical protein [Singulisphaera acidiphila]